MSELTKATPEEVEAARLAAEASVERERRLRSRGVEMIRAERERQIEEEGWDADHDSQHTDGTLAIVGALYALPPRVRVFQRDAFSVNLAIALWPRSWFVGYWKPDPQDRIHDLRRAGALIAAEIDRLLAEKERTDG